MNLQFRSVDWDAVLNHMDNGAEQAAFLFARVVDRTDVWSITDMWLLHESDYTVCATDQLVLEDDIRPRVIKHAHKLQAAVVEVHSHLWPGVDTQFSLYDMNGLLDFAPHMLWRLPNRPYFAMVIGQESFDAVAWSGPQTVETLEEVCIGNNSLQPTGLSTWALRRLLKGRA